LAKRIIEIPGDSLLRLLTHYTDGDIGLGAELLAVAQSQFLASWLSLQVRDDAWQAPVGEEGVLRPYFFRYEGAKTLRLNDSREAAASAWTPAIEAPHRQ